MLQYDLLVLYGYMSSTGMSCASCLDWIGIKWQNFVRVKNLYIFFPKTEVVSFIVNDSRGSNWRQLEANCEYGENCSIFPHLACSFICRS